MSSGRSPTSLRSFIPNFLRRQPPKPTPSSQPLPSQPLPPPPPRYIARPDTALPPTYDQTWDTVRNSDTWPLFIREKKSNFEAHMEDNILNEPDWFLRLESHTYSASRVLWPNVVRRGRDSHYNDKHWSLKFLRYAVRNKHQSPLPSAFAGIIVCEVIFTILTPCPEDWPRGIDAISRLTRYTHSAIKDWFTVRRQFESSSPENLDSDEQTRTILYFSPAAGGQICNRRIRKDALDYLQFFEKIGRLRHDEDTFFSWLNNDLRHMAERRHKGRKFFPHASYFAVHGIIVGPHNWTATPLEDLKDEIESRHRLRPEYEKSERPFHRPRSVMSNLQYPAYRVFVFDAAADVAKYVDYWRKGNIPSASSYRNITVRPWTG